MHLKVIFTVIKFYFQKYRISHILKYYIVKEITWLHVILNILLLNRIKKKNKNNKKWVQIGIL